MLLGVFTIFWYREIFVIKFRGFYRPEVMGIRTRKVHTLSNSLRKFFNLPSIQTKIKFPHFAHVVFHKNKTLNSLENAQTIDQLTCGQWTPTLDLSFSKKDRGWALNMQIPYNCTKAKQIWNIFIPSHKNKMLDANNYKGSHLTLHSLSTHHGLCLGIVWTNKIWCVVFLETNSTTKLVIFVILQNAPCSKLMSSKLLCLQTYAKVRVPTTFARMVSTLWLSH
jgi:hypothetical protein